VLVNLRVDESEVNKAWRKPVFRESTDQKSTCVFPNVGIMGESY
jgi:hypothetical protein